MKKTALLLLFCGILISLNAQKPSLNKAYNSFYEKDFVKAKEQIDLCIADEKLSTKAQTWLYKANIYFYLANDEYSKKQENDNYTLLFPATPEEAYDAFIKAEAINKNVESFEMFSPAEGKSKLYSLLLLYGVDKLLKNDFENAARILQKSVASYEMKTPPDYPLQGELYYYYAYNLEMLQRNDEAITYYQKAINEGSNNVNVYNRLIEFYKNAGQEEQVIELINTGKKNNPNDPYILVAEVEYIWQKDKTKGLAMLEKLPASVYNNSDALVNMANLYIKSDDVSKAENLLQKANQITPGNYVICYNLGYCYLKLYEQKFFEGNELSAKGNRTEGIKLIDAANVILDKAELNFEIALKIDPKDLAILEQLREIYAKKQDPKYNDIIKQIESIKNK